MSTKKEEDRKQLNFKKISLFQLITFEIQQKQLNTLKNVFKTLKNKRKQI